MRHGKAIMALSLLISGTSATLAQQRGSLVCDEEVSIRLTEPKEPTDANIQTIAGRKFSITWNRDLLNLIAAGGTDFYECQTVTRRLNEATPKNAVKCQNGIYFFTLDLTRLKFVKAQLNPQDKTDVGISYGTCRPI